MNGPEFLRRFKETEEIGRDIADDELRVFYDNGREVGCFRQDRRTTQGKGEILGEDDAVACRDWCRRQKAQQEDRGR